MNKDTLNEILKDWQMGLTEDEICEKYNLNDEQSHAILFSGVSKSQILQNIHKINEGKSNEVIMSRWFGQIHNVTREEDKEWRLTFTCHSCGVTIKRDCSIQSWAEWMMAVRAFEIRHPCKEIEQYLEAVER